MSKRYEFASREAAEREVRALREQLREQGERLHAIIQDRNNDIMELIYSMPHNAGLREKVEAARAARMAQDATS